MHPAKEGFSALPFFDEFDLSTVDVLLISQYVSPSFFALHELQSLESVRLFVQVLTSPDVRLGLIWQSTVGTCLDGSTYFLPGYIGEPNTIECHANISCIPVPF
jgi:hypothetical protein